MKELSKTSPTIFIEEMNGFEHAVATLDIPDISIQYLKYQDILHGIANNASAIGAIKGPRGEIQKNDVDVFATAHPDFAIAYIGRHADKILAQDVAYTLAADNTVTLATEQKTTRLYSMEHSPLSDAVVAFVFHTSARILHQDTAEISKLTIPDGNTFTKREGHFYTSDSECTYRLDGKRVGVVGAGDIGKKVIEYYVRAGSEVSYTAEVPKKFAHDDIEFKDLPTLLTQDLDVLTLHLPSRVHVPLEQVRNVRLFIHTASGSNIDEQALLDALHEGRIQQALIDVYQIEGKSFNGGDGESQSVLNPQINPQDTPLDLQRKAFIAELITQKRLFLTPHIAYREDNALKRTLAVALQKIMNTFEKEGAHE
jgi:hypothetical protein